MRGISRLLPLFPTGGAIVALAVGLAPTTGHAQSTAADRMDAIERQMRQMQSELQQLKSELRQSRGEAQRAKTELRQAREAAGRARQDAASAAVAESHATQAAARAQAVAAVPPPPGLPAGLPPGLPPGLPTGPSLGLPAPKVAQTAGNRFGLESADGRNSIYLTGRLHLDAGDYMDFTPQSKSAAVQNLNSGFNARRARLGVTGKFGGDWNYTLIYDFGGSSDGLPPTAGAPISGIEAAFISYNGFNRGPLPLAFDIGFMDTPFTLEEATSSNDIMFVERPTIQTVASGIFAGDFRSAAGARSNNDRYWAGVYLTGPQSGAAHNTGEQIAAFGRATYQVLQDADYSFHLGVDAGGLLKPPTVGGVRTITLSDRPELRVDPTAILGTGALGTAANPVDNAAVYGVEGVAAYQNFFVQGEYYHIDVDRRGLPTNGFDGGYVEGSWTLTGEHRNYIPATGAYSSIVPAHPFSPWSDDYGTGALELAARYSTIDLNDNFTPGVPPGKTNAVGGGRQTVYSVGLNWYPNTNIRFMFDYLHGDINKKFSTAADSGIAGTALGTPVGGNFDAVVLRSQFAF